MLTFAPYQIAFACTFLFFTFYPSQWGPTGEMLCRRAEGSVSALPNVRRRKYSQKREKRGSCVLFVVGCGAQSFRNYGGSWSFL